MNAKMNVKHTRLLCALLLSMLAACATDEGNNPKQESAPAPKVDTPRAAAPCTDCAKPVAPKVIVDGNLAWRQGKEQDLGVARVFVGQSETRSLPTTLKTGFVEKKDEATGKMERLEALKSVGLRPIATDKVSANDKIWGNAIRDLGKRAAQANVNEPQQIIVSITVRNKERVMRWLSEGIAAASNNQKPDIQVFDAKLPKDTAIFYQPLDQKQFIN